MSFFTTDQLSKAVKDVLQRDILESLLPQWDTTITRANTEAYGLIVRSLAKRGFSKAQIDQWDDGAEFQEAIGLWRALTTLRAMQPDVYSQDALDRLDRRVELTGDPTKQIEPVAVLINGEIATPAMKWGQITTGGLDTSEDTFGRLDETDTRIGEILRT